MSANSSLQLTVIRTISLVMAVVAVIKFYQALKTDLKHHRPLVKFLCFKLIVGLTFLLGVCLCAPFSVVDRVRRSIFMS